MDERANDYGDRSRLVEEAVRAFLLTPRQDDLDAHDLLLIDRHAEELNEEAADALDYQVAL
ncbi:MAG TPA: hypothetical protein VGG06_05245 [Thermoanaerobaculia bacterium]